MDAGKLRRDLGVHAGYGASSRSKSATLTQDFDNETIDIGVDFSRSFSMARRTTLGVLHVDIDFQDRHQHARVSSQWWRGSVEVLPPDVERVDLPAAARPRSCRGFTNRCTPIRSAFPSAGCSPNALEWSSAPTPEEARSAFSKTTGFDQLQRRLVRLSFAINKYLGLYGRYTLLSVRTAAKLKRAGPRRAHGKTIGHRSA